mmetsp:Transcript_46698/g.99710  ORF Transcript_46698/g.99710 Transcript_46698/m.99710 type:complete len:322 (-) Transcript_46698:121-1086(-)
MPESPGPSACRPGPRMACQRPLRCVLWGRSCRSHAGDRRDSDDPGGVHVALHVCDVALDPLQHTSEPAALVLHFHPVTGGDTWPGGSCAAPLAVVSRRRWCSDRRGGRNSEGGEVLRRVEGPAGTTLPEFHGGPLGDDDGLRRLPVHEENGWLRSPFRSGDHLRSHGLPSVREAGDLGFVQAAALACCNEHAGNLHLQVQRDGELKAHSAARTQRPGRHALQQHAPPAHHDLALAAPTLEDNLLREVHALDQPLQQVSHLEVLRLSGGASAGLNLGRHKARVGNAGSLQTHPELLGVEPGPLELSTQGCRLPTLLLQLVAQ